MREPSEAGDADQPSPGGPDEQVEVLEEIISDDFEFSESPLPGSLEPVEETGPEKLMSLQDALKRIPESLRNDMKDLLRAEFREVRLWKQGNRH